MIFELEAPINQNITEMLVKFFLENGIDEEKAKYFAGQMTSFAFFVVDAEISHRFPDYMSCPFMETANQNGSKLSKAPDDIQKLVEDAIKKVNSDGEVIRQVGPVVKIKKNLDLPLVIPKSKDKNV
jgi:hypothetical protein